MSDSKSHIGFHQHNPFQLESDAFIVTERQDQRQWQTQELSKQNAFTEIVFPFVSALQLYSMFHDDGNHNPKGRNLSNRNNEQGCSKRK